MDSATATSAWSILSVSLPDACGGGVFTLALLIRRAEFPVDRGDLASHWANRPLK
jgi:hypothetical protein